ncbi:hypothetical protein SBA3_2920009 [Candidatus Sulfopaludibacter sp. SbA3]|nr:hypothetical protein SBA3_2920009 [Candidatus Sulfopaludibacter sp. SbA3]
MGALANSLEYRRKALALAEELASAIPSNLLARRDLADTCEGLGSITKDGATGTKPGPGIR